jgi:hypothetical protein
MRGLLLLSALMGHIVVPIWAARERDIRKSIQKAFFLLAVLDCIYAIALRYAYWQLS